MIDIKALIEEALAAGFSQAGELNCEALEFMPEVRDMCAADRCHNYAKNWACPPGCGSIVDAAKKASLYSSGIIVQTIGRLEDDFDWDSIQAAGAKHNETFKNFTAFLRKRTPNILPMGSGPCTVCTTCTYPDAPCRFPDLVMPSMEAYGLFVSNVCTSSGVPYNNGPQSITFTSCYLIDMD
ncbi:MAG: DUF2284 domain-containing protein [Clostridiales bacterium]|nr:DUF2284 domain-containing protein [Clostridiales bacterium]